MKTIMAKIWNSVVDFFLALAVTMAFMGGASSWFLFSWHLLTKSDGLVDNLAMVFWFIATGGASTCLFRSLHGREK